jgi:DNA polymerase-3 subunit delta
LYGAEPYLIQRAVRLVRKAVLVVDNDDFNDNQFTGRETTAGQILEAVLTLPVFAERRLVTIRDAQHLPAAEMEQLIDYLQQPVAETCLLLTADKIDSRRKFFQSFKKHGLIIEFKPLAEKNIAAHVRQVLEQREVSISADALRLFSSMVSTSLHEIHAEIDKLINYIGTAQLVDIKDVQAVVSRGRAENVFELGNAVGRGDSAKALTLALRLSSAGEPPLRVLSLLVRHFRQLWKVRELQVQKASTQDIARIAGVPFFVVEGMVQQGKRFSRRDFVQAHELFLETDLAMKSSGADPAALLESLILRLVRKTSHKKGG